MNGAIKKADILIETLPYIRNFYGKTVVIKYGGSAMLNCELKEKVIKDLLLMRYVGINVVLVHGGGPEISSILKKVGKHSKFINGLRVTDKETMEIAEMVLAGKINKEIVALINKNGGKAVGITGKDGNLAKAKKMVLTNDMSEPTDLGFVGEICEVNPQLLKTLFDDGCIPVIASIAMGEDGETYNINADHMAQELAIALKAEKLVFLTDVEGILEDYNNPDSLLSVLTVKDALEKIKNGGISGGMIPKVEACIKSIKQGVRRTHIIDGRIPHSLLLEIFTDKGIGTMVIE
ncbi:MAG: acetylglutamate kinase [Thermosediminibacterales bacterium]|nr:acetylglutamate kinase [Thermosediminibacterales bacterium]